MFRLLIPQPGLSKAMAGKLQVIAIGPKGGQIVGYAHGDMKQPIYAGSAAAAKLAKQGGHNGGDAHGDLGLAEWLDMLGSQIGLAVAHGGGQTATVTSPSSPHAIVLAQATLPGSHFTGLHEGPAGWTAQATFTPGVKDASADGGKAVLVHQGGVKPTGWPDNVPPPGTVVKRSLGDRTYLLTISQGSDGKPAYLVTAPPGAKLHVFTSTASSGLVKGTIGHDDLPVTVAFKTHTEAAIAVVGPSVDPDTGVAKIKSTSGASWWGWWAEKGKTAPVPTNAGAAPAPAWLEKVPPTGLLTPETGLAAPAFGKVWSGGLPPAAPLPQSAPPVPEPPAAPIAQPEPPPTVPATPAGWPPEAAPPGGAHTFELHGHQVHVEVVDAGQGPEYVVTIPTDPNDVGHAYNSLEDLKLHLDALAGGEAGPDGALPTFLTEVQIQAALGGAPAPAEEPPPAPEPPAQPQPEPPAVAPSAPPAPGHPAWSKLPAGVAHGFSSQKTLKAAKAPENAGKAAVLTIETDASGAPQYKVTLPAGGAVYNDPDTGKPLSPPMLLGAGESVVFGSSTLAAEALMNTPQTGFIFWGMKPNKHGKLEATVLPPAPAAPAPVASPPPPPAASSPLSGWDAWKAKHPSISAAVAAAEVGTKIDVTTPGGSHHMTLVKHPSGWLVEAGSPASAAIMGTPSPMDASGVASMLEGLDSVNAPIDVTMVPPESLAPPPAAPPAPPAPSKPKKKPKAPQPVKKPSGWEEWAQQHPGAAAAPDDLSAWLDAAPPGTAVPIPGGHAWKSVDASGWVDAAGNPVQPTGASPSEIEAAKGLGPDGKVHPVGTKFVWGQIEKTAGAEMHNAVLSALPGATLAPNLKFPDVYTVMVPLSHLPANVTGSGDKDLIKAHIAQILMPIFTANGFAPAFKNLVNNVGGTNAYANVKGDHDKVVAVETSVQTIYPTLATMTTAGLHDEALFNSGTPWHGFAVDLDGDLVRDQHVCVTKVKGGRRQVRLKLTDWALSDVTQKTAGAPSGSISIGGGNFDSKAGEITPIGNTLMSVASKVVSGHGWKAHIVTDDTQAWAMHGAVNLDVEPGVSVASALGEFAAAVGLPDLAEPPTEEKRENFRLRKLLWNAAPSVHNKLFHVHQQKKSPPPSAAKLREALIKAGVKPEHIDKAEVVTIGSGHRTIRIPDGQRFVDQGVLGFRHNWYSSDARDLARKLAAGGNTSTAARWKTGMGGSGLSSDADMHSGGGDYVFNYVMKESTTGMSGFHVGHGLAVITGVDTLERADWHSAPNDNYGSTKNNVFKKRSGRYEMPATANEVMVQHSVGLDEVRAIYCDTDKKRSDAIAEFKALGVHSIGGRPVEEVVVTSIAEAKKLIKDAWAKTQAERA